MKPARSGIALIEVIMALMIGTALVFIGIYEVERYRYFRDMEKGINTMNILYRDLRVLESKAKDVDGDGYYEPLKETSTGEIPDTVSIQKTDLWGNPIKYCTWDLGRKNTVDPDYSDNNQPPPVSGLTIRLISAGPNGVFDTTCDDTTKQGDDLVVEGYQDETKLVALGASIGWWLSKDNNGQTDIYNRNDGYVGIGTNTPLTKLHIEGPIVSGGTDYTDIPYYALVLDQNGNARVDAVYSYAGSGNTGGYMAIAPGPAGTTATDLYLYELTCPNNSCNIPNVYVYADTTTFTGDVVVEGNLSVNGAPFYISDINAKENVCLISDKELSKYNRLKPVKYTLKSNGITSYGFIAQDLQKLYPELVKKVGNRYEVNYIGIITLNTAEILKLKQEIENLKKHYCRR